MIRITFYCPRIFTKKYWKERKQLRQQGFLDEDTYSLRNPLAKFIFPRLKRFREVCAHSSEWGQMLDRMIWSFNEIVENDGQYPEEEPPDFSDQGMIDSDHKRRIYYAKLQEGLTLFGRNFCGFWW